MSGYSFAQNLNESERQILFLETLKSSEFVFEGELVRQEYFYSEKNQKAMVSVYYNITRVIKGDLQLGTIEIVYRNLNGVKRDERINGPLARTNMRGLGFAKKLTSDVELSELYKADNSTRLTANEYNPIHFVEYVNNKKIDIPQLGIAFETIPDFYNFLNEKSNLKIKPIPSVKSTPPPVDSAVIKHDKERWDAYQKLLEHKKQFVQ